MGTVTSKERALIINNSLVSGVYEDVVDRQSAYELLKKRAESAPKSPPPKKKKRARRSDTAMEAMTKSAARTLGSKIANELVRGILGSLLGGKRRSKFSFSSNRLNRDSKLPPQ